jgi:hypothetical protein
MYNQDLNTELRRRVTAASQNPEFVHHAWFVEYHLDVVQHIAAELCSVYPKVDAKLVDALVWLHDYEKIIDFDNQYNTELVATRRLMEEVGYEKQAIEDMAGIINRYNAKQDLPSAPIELQIVSSADGASHLVGPFITLYWYEHPHKSIGELQADNRKKLATDWSQKITLPEVKAAFNARYQFALEHAGQLPARYF